MKTDKKITGEELGGLLFSIHEHYPTDKEEFNENNSEKIIYYEEDLLPLLEAIGLPKVEWGKSLNLKDWLTETQPIKVSGRLGKVIPMDKFIPIMETLVRDEEFPYEIPTQLTKDLSKINFDWENYEYLTGQGFSNYPCGYETLSNGLPVLFMNAGGDWEFPICFVLYWDGKQVRGYIPTDGNVFNTVTKAAYGNEPDGEEVNHYDFEGNPEKIRQDVVKRITAVY